MLYSIYHEWFGKLSPKKKKAKKKILFVVNEDWFFYSHRLSLALACKKNGWEVSIMARINNHAELIRGAGFTLISSRMQRGKIGIKSLWNEFRAIIELRQVIRQQDPLVLHLVGLKPVVFGALATLFCRPALTVNALTGMGYIFTSARWKIRAIRETIKFALRLAFKNKRAFLIVQNHSDAEDLLISGVAHSEQIAVIMGSGVNINKFVPRAEPHGPIVVAYVGRMLLDKGINELVKAARELRARKVSAKFILVGKPDVGNPTSILEEKLEEWSREGILKWVGYRDDIRAIWRSAHIAVLPSYREGMPLSLLEASATGLPLVATDVPGCRELVDHGHNGFIVPSHDWKNLANAIEELVLAPDTRRAMGLAARKKVESCYDEETVILQTIRIYERAFTGLE